MDEISKQLIKVGLALTSTRELNQLLDLILTEARHMTKADAGSIYLVEKDHLLFETSQNKTLSTRHGEQTARGVFKRQVLPLNAKSIAGFVALNRELINLPDVYNIPAHYGFVFNSTWDTANDYRSKSMLAVPMTDQEDNVVGVLQLINAKDDQGQSISFSDDFEPVLSAFACQAAVAIINARLHQELKDAHLDTVFRLGVAAEYRDKETANHIKRVSELSVLVGRKLDLSSEQLEILYWAAAMHDVGKLGIPDAILHKPGPLTTEERDLMEYHTLIGAKILQGASSPLLHQARVVALTHHEKFNGTGYPKKMKGEDIPILGRITALADVLDALSSRRVYKPAFPEAKVMEILDQERGEHFDPRLVTILFDNFDQVRVIQQEYADSEEDFDKFRNVSALKSEIEE